MAFRLKFLPQIRQRAAGSGYLVRPFAPLRLGVYMAQAIGGGPIEVVERGADRPLRANQIVMIVVILGIEDE